MRPRRFFIPCLSEADSPRLIGDERHHAVDVLRLSVGARLELFDEQGRTATAQIVSIDADAVHLQLLSPPVAPRTNNMSLHLAVAAPKQKRVDWLVEKCAELGVERLQFINTERSEVTPSANRIERWQRKATEAAKQSGALPAMEISPAIYLAAFVEQMPDGAIAIFGSTENGTASLINALRELELSSSTTLVMFIGPEGGWSASEITQLKSNSAIPVRLNNNVLRVETAAVAMAAICQAILNSD